MKGPEDRNNPDSWTSGCSTSSPLLYRQSSSLRAAHGSQVQRAGPCALILQAHPARNSQHIILNAFACVLSQKSDDTPCLQRVNCDTSSSFSRVPSCPRNTHCWLQISFQHVHSASVQHDGCSGCTRGIKWRPRWRILSGRSSRITCNTSWSLIGPLTSCERHLEQTCSAACPPYERWCGAWHLQ